MTCENWQKDVALYVEGDLPSRQALLLESHMDSCPACRSFRDEFAETQAIFKGLRNETVKDESLDLVRDRVMKGVETGRKTAVLPSIPLKRKWAYQLGGVAAVALISLGLWSLPGETPPDESPVERSASREPVDEVAVLPTPEDVPFEAEGTGTTGTTGTIGTIGTMETTKTTGEMDSVESSAPNGPLLPAVATRTASNTVDRSQLLVSNAAEDLVVKLLTDDPKIVIYWVIDQAGGQE
jgi:hypothetical protein